MLSYVLIFALLLTASILYQKYLDKQLRTRSIHTDDYAEIRKYLLRDKTLEHSKKPLLWIHVPYEYNARQWMDFGSRSSTHLNQPYLYLTVKTIIKHCDASFKIVIIDDNTFSKLMPSWNVRLDVLSDPVKQYMRQLAMAKLLYLYGGMHVPLSFLCFRDLIGLYHAGTNDDTMFVCENYDANITSTNRLFYPNAGFMGAKKENPTMQRFIHFLEQTISDDFTAQTQFVGQFDKWCHHKIVKGHMRLIRGTDVGTRTVDDDPVTVDTLLSDDYIHFYGKMYGIWIPSHALLNRRHYEWFTRLSAEQLVDSHFILAKYFVLALAPDSHLGVIEPLENKDSKWIGFYKVPLTNGTLNVFGPMPQGLGNNVPRVSASGEDPSLSSAK